MLNSENRCRLASYSFINSCYAYPPDAPVITANFPRMSLSVIANLRSASIFIYRDKDSIEEYIEWGPDTTLVALDAPRYRKLFLRTRLVTDCHDAEYTPYEKWIKVGLSIKELLPTLSTAREIVTTLFKPNLVICLICRS
jgi:hypothetical protein